MRASIKKKFFCFLFLITLVAAAAGSLSEAPGAEAFAGAASAFFNSFRPEREALKLTVEPPEGEALSGTLTLKDGLLTLQSGFPGMPSALQIGKDAAWFLSDGQVYEIRYSDFSPKQNPFGEETLPALQEIAGLFASRILAPGLTAEQGEGAITIRFSYDAKTILPALAECVDTVVQSDRYLSAILSVLNANARASGEDAVSPEDVRAAWSESRAMLLALPVDASLSGTTTLSSDSLDGHAVLSLPGAEYALTFTGKGNGGKTEFSASFSAPEGEAAALRFLCDRPAGTFEGSASLPMLRNELRITGKRSAGILTGEANVTARGVSVMDVSLSLSGAGAPLWTAPKSGQLVIRPATRRILGGQTFTVEFDCAPGRFRAALNGGGRSAAVKWQTSWDGRFSGSLALPDPYPSAALSGRFRSGALHAEGSLRSAMSGTASFALDWSGEEQRFSLQGSVGGSKGSVSLSWDSSGGFDAAFEAIPANVGKSFPVSGKVSGLLHSDGFSLDYELNHRGKLASGSLSANGIGKALSVLGTLNLFREKKTLSFQLNRMDSALEFSLNDGANRIAGSLSENGNLEIRQSGEDRISRSLTGGFDGTGDYLLDFAVTVNPGYAPVPAHENHMLLRASAGGGEQLSLTLTEQNIRRGIDGTARQAEEPAQRFAAALSRIPAEPVPLLSAQNPVRLTPDQLMSLYSDR